MEDAPDLTGFLVENEKPAAWQECTTGEFSQPAGSTGNGSLLRGKDKKIRA